MRWRNVKNSKDDNELIKKQEIVKGKLIDQYIKYRKIKNLTQGELADVMGIKRPNISRFESGQCNPTLDLLVKMADSMDLEIKIDLIDKSKRKEDSNE